MTAYPKVELRRLVEKEAPIQYGILQPGPDLPVGVPYVRPTEIGNDGSINMDGIRRTSPEIAHKYRRAAIKTGDILITIVGTLGRIAMVPPELNGGNITQSSARIRPLRSQIDQRFLFWALQSSELKRQYDRHRLGTGVPRLNIAHVRGLTAPHPPLPEQRRIAAILDKADAIRRKRREAVALTEELLRSAFLEMFGDPVTNPKGWPTVRLDSLVRPGDRINYGVVQPGPDVPSGRPLIRVTDIVTGHIDQTKMKLIAADIDAQYSRSKLVGDEVLVACVGSIGAVARAKAAHRGFNIARAVSRVPLCDAVETPYIEECLRSSFVQEYFRSQLRTVAQPTLNVKQLKATPIRLPPRKLQKHFARIQGQVHILRRKVRSSSVHDDTLFHSLVQRAFRGEL